MATHKVVSGDTVYALAEQYGVTVEQIVSWNNLADANEIQVGQDLKMAEEYTVKTGDTLSEIAKEHGVSMEDLTAANPDITDPNKIQIGQKIFLPAQR